MPTQALAYSVHESGSTLGTLPTRLRSVAAAVIYTLLLACTTQAQQQVASLEATLVAPDGASGDYFGQAVAISGDTALVGAYSHNSGAGAAYVFVRAGGQWTIQAALTAAVPDAWSYFGYSVALDGDTAVIGAFSDHDAGGTATGAAYVFQRVGSTWTQQQKLVASDGATNDSFGMSVAISGSTILVGAYQYTVGPGAAYVFLRHGNLWTQQAKLTASDGVTDDWFGVAVDIDADTAIIGAQSDDSIGSAYVFQRTGSTWAEEAKLHPSAVTGSPNFGGAVAIEGDIAAVGAFGDNAGGLENRGSAFVFARTGTTWREQAKLVASDAVDLAWFGRPVSLSEGVLAIGAIGASSSSEPGAGAAYVFTNASGSWEEQFKLSDPNAGPQELVGSGVSVDDETIIVGAPGHDHSGDTNIGDAFAFRLVNGGTWATLGNGLSGSTGESSLAGQGFLLADSLVTLSLSNAKKLSPAPLIVGIGNLSAPFKGGVIVPTPDFIFPLFTDFSGNAVFGGPWPASIPSGFTTYFQWWIQDPAGPKGFAASNALAGTTP